MMRMWKWVVVVSAGAALIGCKGSETDKDTQESDMETSSTQPDAATREPSYALDLTVNRIDGTPQDLSDYEGQVVLVVNVASRCGLTPQYEGLESLYRSRRHEGLVVLGFPANDFGAQEPGANSEIAEFCDANYGVTFPMFEKVTVKGDAKHELYQTLSMVGGEPTWNFTKYLIDRQGNVVERFDPRTEPDAPALRDSIDRLLSEG